MLFSLMSNAVTPVDTMRRIDLPPIYTLLYDPVTIAVSADGLYAYTLSANFNEPEVPSTWKGYISRFNLITQTQEADIKVLQSPTAMALTSGGFAYVVHRGGALLPVNLVTGKTHRPMGIYNNPVSIAITPDDEWAYVVTQETNTVTPVKLSTRRVFAGIPVGRYPLHVAISSNGRRAFVANFEDKSITPIDLQSRKPLAPIQLDQKPSSVAVTPDGRMLCAIHPETNEVSIIARSR
jgi:YVTN family beta-propeller protein